MSNSCSTCASCVRSPNVASVFGTAREYGSDMCTTFGLPLSIPRFTSEQNAGIKDRIGSDCPQWTSEMWQSDANSNLAAPAQPCTPSPQVLMQVMNAPAPDPTEKPSSCMACKYFTMPAAVFAEWGFNGGVCAAKGQLVSTVEAVPTARECPVGVRGTPRSSIEDMALDPRLSGIHYVNATPSAPLGDGEYSKHNLIDPREWPTDRDVNDADVKNGIRAWRAIEDPEGLRPPVWLPIYDHKLLFPDGYDPRPTVATYMPDLYVDHQFLLYDFAFLYGAPTSHEEDTCLSEVMALLGKAGVGKTEFAAYVAWLMNLPFIRIVIQPGTEASDIYGEKDLVVDAETGVNKTEWRWGRFAKWFGLPCVLLVDEPNMGREEVWAPMRPAYDGAREISVEAAQGLTRKRHKSCYPILAMNPSWDPLYIGTNPINVADLNRLTPTYVELPPVDVEKRIIRAHCAEVGYDIPEDTLDTIMAIAGDLRAQEIDGTLPIPWGMRSQIKVAKMTWRFGLPKSYLRAVADGCEPEVRDVIMACVSNHFEGDAPAGSTSTSPW